MTARHHAAAVLLLARIVILPSAPEHPALSA